MSSASHHEKRFSVAIEDQAVCDRTDLTAELAGGRDRCLGVGVEDLDVGLDTGGGDGATREFRPCTFRRVCM
jgi:hypothetical protein